MGVLISMLWSTSAVDDSGSHFQTIKQLGIGKVSTFTTIDLVTAKTGVKGLVSNSFIVNIGQLLFSLMYFSYNRVFTIFSGAAEWESYAIKRKGLRVSQKPHGEQRSTYFLALPYRIAVPLLMVSGVLHWLVSQSIFLVVIENRRYDGQSNSWIEIVGADSMYFRCGFSPLAIICLLVVVGIMLFGLIVVGSLHLKTDMPVVGNCSAAISAACHVPINEDGRETSISCVKWGVTGYRNDGIGHCAFSKLEVTAPQAYQLYE